jgi:hypothetical protein
MSHLILKQIDNSNVILIMTILSNQVCYAIFITVKRLGAPLTQAFGT